MRKSDFNKIKTLEIKGLLLKVKDLKVEISNLIIDKNMNKLKNMKLISHKKRDVAQIMTVLRQKQLLEQLETEGQRDKETEREKIGGKVK